MGYFITSLTHKAGSWSNIGFFKKAACNTGVTFIFFVIIISLVGCSQEARSNPRPGAVYREETVILPTSAPTLEPTPANTRVLPIEVLTPALTPTITPIPDEIMGLVVDVIDGDTIEIWSWDLVICLVPIELRVLEPTISIVAHH